MVASSRKKNPMAQRFGLRAVATRLGKDDSLVGWLRQRQLGRDGGGNDEQDDRWGRMEPGEW
jgi:hypothetical protein